jgi:hypothetical protein
MKNCGTLHAYYKIVIIEVMLHSTDTEQYAYTFSVFVPSFSVAN